MKNVNFKFIASGLGHIVKANIYPLVPVVEHEMTTNGNFVTHNIKQPIADVYGKYVIMPLVLKTKDGNSLSIPEAIVNITKRKIITQTQLVGGNGTIKEYICDDDMDISIAVGIVATDQDGNIIDEYPFDGIKQLREILDLKEAIDVTSDFLKIFDLDGGDFKIVVTEYTIQQSTAYNRQVVDIKAISDFDYTIKYFE